MEFRVYPRVFQVSKRSGVMIEAKGIKRTFNAELTLIPAVGGDTIKKTAVFTEGKACAEFLFKHETEYSLIIHGDGEKSSLRLYALQKDLFELKPLKGDLHMHTNLSDGEDSPAFVAASSREIGMDFIAITDHYRYEPSLEAIEAVKGSDTGLEVFPGEEIHPPDNRIHMINFGGNESVNKMFDGNKYKKDVMRLEKKECVALPAEIRYSCASCLWVFGRIKKAGGISVFCHPHWFVHDRYDADARITEFLFRTKKFDVLELIGGYHKFETESNALTAAYWAEKQAEYGNIPVVGSSDEHGVTNGKLFGWYYTIAFAGSNKFKDIASAIRNFRTVAVEALPGESVHVFGQFRYVKYAYFLLREYFPERDKICVEEGSLLKTFIDTKKGAAKIKAASDKAEEYRKRFFAGTGR